MNQSDLVTQNTQIVQVNWSDRWQVYQRLQELEIPCWCASNQPLRVQIENFVAAAQFRSVLMQLSAPRQELSQWLEHCWKLS
jgi:hypothetical protein